MNGYLVVYLTEENAREGATWAPCPGFGGFEVSDTGHVRNASTKLELGGVGETNRRRVRINGKWVAVGKLVAAAFLPPPPQGGLGGGRPRLQHLDGDPNNCHVSNLAW